MARLISSIPLLRHGFPPLCITPSGREAYYDSTNIVSHPHALSLHRLPTTLCLQAWEGDYQPMINCFVNCISDAMTDVERMVHEHKT